MSVGLCQQSRPVYSPGLALAFPSRWPACGWELAGWTSMCHAAAQCTALHIIPLLTLCHSQTCSPGQKASCGHGQGDDEEHKKVTFCSREWWWRRQWWKQQWSQWNWQEPKWKRQLWFRQQPLCMDWIQKPKGKHCWKPKGHCKGFTTKQLLKTAKITKEQYSMYKVHLWFPFGHTTDSP